MHENIVIIHMRCNARRVKIKNAKPTPKILRKPLQLKKIPNIFQKPPIFRSKDMKKHEKEGLRHLPSEENLIEAEKS